MNALEMMWAYSPKETTQIIVIAIVCAAMMAVLIGLLAWPEDPEMMEG